MSDTYRTVAGRATAGVEVRGPEFLGHVAPADTVAEADALAETVEAEHDDATHHVPAYRLPAGAAPGPAPPATGAGCVLCVGGPPRW